MDENSGNINHLISKELRDKYEWNPSLLSKIDNYLKPAIEIKEHNFSDNSLNINVTFNALYIIKIGKNNTLICIAKFNLHLSVILTTY